MYDPRALLTTHKCGYTEEMTEVGYTFGWNAPRSPDPTVFKGAVGSPGGPGSRGDIPGKPGIWKQKTLTIILVPIGKRLGKSWQNPKIRDKFV